MELFKIFGTVALNGADETNRELANITNTAEKSTSKFAKLGGIATTLGKGILVATGAVATGAVALVKKVSGSYGQLQQSIGGIETLFGESANKVIKNANNAYTTAGISANEYMQQVTSFSASLLQALGGDTEKACDSADMAIRDMADNANKMGTSMESIQNAYQGFSKQNYTMLDNLKLGYGGTKTEMERLLKDAEKMSGIKYDISNLNDVYQAIHVIQGELGITGTTAQEAGETIQGSFNSLGASWQNFLAGLGDPNADMQEIVNNLAKGINGAVNNVIPIINNMVQVLPTVMDAIINAISSMLPTLIQTFTELLTKVINAIVQLLPQLIPLAIQCIMTVTQALIENLPLIVSAGIQLILGLAQGISQALPQLLPIVVTVVKEIVMILLDNIDSIIQIGVELLLALIEGLTVALPQLIDMLPSIIEKIVSVIMSNLPLIISCGVQILGALINGIIKTIPSLVLLIPRVLKSLFTGFLKGVTSMNKIGSQLMDGLLNGVKTGFNNVVNWINSHLKLPHLKLSGSINPTEWFTGNLPHIGVEWYANGGVMTKPTLFGVNPQSGNAMVGGERGKEAIAPIDTLQQYVSEAVKKETDGLSYQMSKVVDILGQYLPEIKDNLSQDICLDGKSLVDGISKKMDLKLGNMANSKARFGV